MANPVPTEAEELLTSEPLMAHFATCAEGRPHVAPVWYHYHDGVLEVLTTGRKLANVRENPRVAVSVQKDDRGRAEWMVSLRGTATVVEDEEARREAAARINPKYGAPAEEYPENVLVRVAVGSAHYQTY
ncbi:pyridoxamine 5'-phosphate oxidase family protein [Halorussus salilacus]|uniref:pyridoxamine 5'-phosphate oxidase family protein n=1 Tax=Halorussus salilacus TaxID=2953750 RepID=UPI00209EC47C|nr:pyridoxamine 5'-phosphate oxidase family protein [Halorussus salilacus]USZ67488.1 pyridoxamine 5'-phosphate oxidase family protein [Halorussus salilacus]